MPDRRSRWREVSGIPVEAPFLRAVEALGGPAVLGYPITPGLFAGDALQQYFNHGRLDVPGRSSVRQVGVPRLANLGLAMALALQAPPAGGSAGPFADPWTDESRRDRAGPPASAPFDWRGWRIRLYDRDLVRMLDRSPVDARPTPGHLGDLFVTLDEAERARGATGPVPVQRPITDPPPEVQVPILTYHRTAGPAAFQAQLEGLMDAGLTPVSFERLVAAIEGWAEVPDGAFVVSFDDGWLDQLDGALPVLEALRVPAVFFVLPGFDRHGQGHMTLADIQAVRAAGVTVGSHTINHADLPPLYRTNLGAAQAEVVESRQRLEADVDGVDYFAYPLGRFDPDVIALVAAAEYRAAVTTVPGIVHNMDRLLELRRIGVETWWPLADVVQRIREAAQFDGVPSPI